MEKTGTIRIPILPYSCILLLCLASFLFAATVSAGGLNLQDLIHDALKHNPEILISRSKEFAAGFRVPQAKSLPDPMFMFGYMNEGTRDLYTFGDKMVADSQWMFSVSQMFPFPGKLSLKGEMASRDTRSMKALSDFVRLNIVARVKELYYELFFTYKNIDIVKDKDILFSRIEEAALARYSSGMAPQQEAIMAQTGKYMLREQEEILNQKIQSLEAMLNSVTGKEVNSPLGRPVEVSPTPYTGGMNTLLLAAYENSPWIKAKEEMIAAAKAKVSMAEKEYYPDFTVSANYFAKSSDFPDMWSLTTAVTIPLYYKSKQKNAVLEAEALLSEARNELEAAKLMISSAVRDHYSKLRTSENLRELYRGALIPKAYQDFESALAGYISGKADAITVISRLKSLLDNELSYWQQLVEREKAIARLEAVTGGMDSFEPEKEK